MTQPRGTSSAMVAFRTDDVPEEHRIELWEGHNAAALIGLRCRTLDGLPLGATELNVQLERVRLARVTGTAHTVERTAEMIRSEPADAVALYFTLVGEAFFYCDDGVRVLRPGQLLVCDVDRPFLRGFSHGLQELAMVVPSALFADVAERAVRRPMVVDFTPGHPHANALAALVGRAVHPSSPTDLAEESVLELMAATIGLRSGPTSANLAAAKIFIDRRLGDQGLSAARVAAGIGLSDRQLSRIFAEQGTSVPQYILGRRLALAHRLLSDAAQIGLPTSEVVRRCGLGSPSHFARAFKERYGLRPAELRSRTRAGHVIDGSFPPSPADFGHVGDSSFSTSR